MACEFRYQDLLDNDHPHYVGDVGIGAAHYGFGLAQLDTRCGIAYGHSGRIEGYNEHAPVALKVTSFATENITIPSFYGQKCVTGLGLRNAFFFRYEQPELINTKEELARGIGSVKVQWSFSGSKITADFAYTVKNQVQLDKFRMALVIAAPHSRYRVPASPVLGPQGHRCSVLKDDFHANWQETEVVTADPVYRTNYGKLHYVQMFVRDHPLIMRPGNVYRIAVNFEPDVVHTD